MTTGRGDFSSQFSQFMKDSGRWRDCEPDALLARWTDFVESCVIGYSGDAEDYFNDLTARGGLEKAMREPSLSEFSEMDELRRAVEVPDSRLREVLRPHAFPRIPESAWWSRGVVRYAGARLAEELRRSFDITIDVVDECL